MVDQTIPSPRGPSIPTASEHKGKLRRNDPLLDESVLSQTGPGPGKHSLPIQHGLRSGA